MWGFATRSARAVEVTPKHEELFRDTDDLAESVTRETSQNSADAKSAAATKVRMRFALATIDLKKFEERWLPGLRNHMDAWRPEFADAAFGSDPVQCLVVEDFGTKGLEGDLYKSGGAFYAFWRQYGESPKGGNTGGRHGVGKSTLAGASRARMFFGSTIRESDGRRLLMGQAILGPHELATQKYDAYGEFSPTVDEDTMPDPFEGQKVDDFASDFDLARIDQPGLSLVVPAVRPEIVQNDLEPVKRALVSNCFPQIASGLLEFEVAGEILDRSTLAQWAARWPDLELAGAVEVALAAFDGPKVRQATERPSIGTESFLTEDLEAMRKEFAEGELVAVIVPVTVITRLDGDKAGSMRLHLRKMFGKLPRAEHYARSRLTVPKQRKVLAGRETVGLLIAEDGPLSDFLGDAEPPSHAKWTHQNLRDAAKYSRTQDTLTKVANALRQFEKLLQDEDAEAVNKDAFKSLFSRPKPKPKPDDDDQPPIPPLPPARPFWKVMKRTGGFEVLRPDETVPADVEIEVAYAKRRGSANWRPTDFQLMGGGILVQPSGAATVSYEGNIVRVSGAEPGFTLTADGFDPNRDVVVVVRATEDTDDQA